MLIEFAWPTFSSWLKDPDGEIFGVDNVIGAIVSGGVEVGTQMISNAIQGERITNISWKKVGIAAGEGFITSGASTGVRIAVKIGAAVAQSTVDNHDKGAAEIVKGTAVNYNTPLISGNYSAVATFVLLRRKGALMKSGGDVTPAFLMPINIIGNMLK